MPYSRIRKHYSRPKWTGESYWRIRAPQTIAVERIGKDDRTCTDTVGNYPNPNGLDISRIVVAPYAILNGEKYVQLGGVSVLDKAYYNFPTVLNASVSSSYSLPSSTEQNDVAIKAMAATNPSAPVMSVPTFVGELKDVPGLVRTWGRRLINFRNSKSWKKFLLRKAKEVGPEKALSEANITYRWVIAPTVSDITAMLKFVSSVQSRVDRLRALRDEGMYSARGPSQVSTMVTTRNNYALDSILGELIYARRDVFEKRRLWGSVQWKTTETGANASNLPQSDRELTALAWKLVMGINSFETLQTAWNLLPWSWFADYFANIGASIGAANNTVKAEPSNFCVMCERTAEVHYTVTSKPFWVKVDLLGIERGVWRWRKVVPQPVPFTLSRLPVLTVRQWSLLASLAALRGR